MPHSGAPRTRPFEAIIDSGASRCVFDSELGEFIGLDIESGERERTHGVDGLTETSLHRIALHVPGGPVSILAAFKPNLPVAGLLGMNGFFEHFLVVFDHVALSCRIERIYRT
jgi:hypothetical protein